MGVGIQMGYNDENESPHVTIQRSRKAMTPARRRRLVRRTKRESWLMTSVKDLRTGWTVTYQQHLSTREYNRLARKAR